MDLKSITKDFVNQDEYHLEKRFNELMRRNSRYNHLDKDNQELILELILKYRKKFKEHIYPSARTIREDMYHLYQDRVKLGLTELDLDQIRDLLESFKE